MILENSAKGIYHKQQSINYQLIKLHNKWFLIGFYSAKRGKKLLVTIEIFFCTMAFLKQFCSQTEYFASKFRGFFLLFGIHFFCILPPKDRSA